MKMIKFVITRFTPLSRSLYCFPGIHYFGSYLNFQLWCANHYPNRISSKMSSIKLTESQTLVEPKEMVNYVIRCMTQVGTKESHALALAEVLVAADLRGHFSHGLNRLEMYVNDIKSGICRSDTEPSLIKETPATAYVNGNNLLGPVVGNFCMDLAIKKAKAVGVGWVVCKGSNHYGIAGWYSTRASNVGLLGLSFTNTSPLVVPTRAKKATLGTNPITLAAPAMNGDSFVLDMATSTVAVGKIELEQRKGNLIPNGWGVDANGKETNDPKAVLSGGGLLPVGGIELSGGYKGYGLAMLVEIFCGILADSAYGPNIRLWTSTSSQANLGQCFIAVDPNAFAPGFEGRLSSLLNYCRDLTPAEGETEVLIPGDPERKHIAKCEKEGGICYHPNQIKHMYDLAARLKVKPLMVTTI